MLAGQIATSWVRGIAADRLPLAAPSAAFGGGCVRVATKPGGRRTMSEKTRNKKDGRDRNKDGEARREAVHERKEHAHSQQHSGDEKDIVTYKSGSAGDRSRQGAT